MEGQEEGEKNLDKGSYPNRAPIKKRVMFYQLKLSCLLSQRYSPTLRLSLILYSCLSLKNNNKGRAWLKKGHKCVKIRKTN